MARNKKTIVTILEYPGVPLDAIIISEQVQHNGELAGRIKLSLTPEAHVAAFCSMQSKGSAVTFVQKKKGTRYDLHYAGLSDGHYQFLSDPDLHRDMSQQ